MSYKVQTESCHGGDHFTKQTITVTDKKIADEIRDIANMIIDGKTQTGGGFWDPPDEVCVAIAEFVERHPETIGNYTTKEIAEDMERHSSGEDMDKDGFREWLSNHILEHDIVRSGECAVLYSCKVTKVQPRKPRPKAAEIQKENKRLRKAIKDALKVAWDYHDDDSGPVMAGILKKAVNDE